MLDSNTVEVEIRVSWRNGICFPDANGEDKVKAIFKDYTYEDNRIIEEMTKEENEHGEASFEPNEFRKLMLKRNLLSWSIPIEIKRERGWITDESFLKIISLSASLIDALVSGFQKTASISEEEEEKIERQSVILFSENSRGVTNACEAISLYCTLGSLWEKFGLDIDRLPNLSFKDFLRLKMMTRKEGEATKKTTRPKQSAGSRVIGPRGMSQGKTKRIPL